MYPLVALGKREAVINAPKKTIYRMKSGNVKKVPKNCETSCRKVFVKDETGRPTFLHIIIIPCCNVIAFVFECATSFQCFTVAFRFQFVCCIQFKVSFSFHRVSYINALAGTSIIVSTAFIFTDFYALS